MVHKNVKIELLVKQLRQESPEFISVVFERPINFIYEAGDWIDVDFVDTSYSGGKTYSLSSSPTENELTLSFREGISPFKKKLQSVQAGDKMYISQYGNDYGFHLNDNRSSVLIAGGIGIAPFRSMLKEMFDMRAKNDVQLVYLNKSEEFLFQDELNEWRRGLPNISIQYIVTKDLKRKAREKLLQSLVRNTAHSYYIAGPSGMVSSTFALLEKSGVTAKDIRVDNFGLY
jgi:ferredoxin-NADP reductase